MRLPADDPLLRLRAAPRREVDAKPVPKKVREASERRTFMRSKFYCVGCTSPKHACSKCQAYQRWRRNWSVVARESAGG